MIASTRLPARTKSYGRGHYNRLPRKEDRQKIAIKNIMGKLAPTIDLWCQPARVARTNRKNRTTTTHQSDSNSTFKSPHLFPSHASKATQAPQVPYKWRIMELFRVRKRYIGLCVSRTISSNRSLSV